MVRRESNWTTVVLIAGISAALWAGCGQRIEAPREGNYELEIPPPDSYTFKFEEFGFGTAKDVELTRGGLLYVTSAAGLTPYYQSVKGGPGYPFAGVSDPAAVCEAPNGRIIIADQGDMFVKIFPPGGGNPDTTFTDTTWTRFGGIAADDSAIYVADIDSSFVRAYRWDGTPRFVDDEGSILDLADSGFGLGHVLEPHGLFHDGRYLWIADTGKNWIQKVEPDSVQLGLAYLDEYTYLDDDGNEIKLPFSSPVDVATDENGYLYVADRGNRQIFKFNEDLEPFRPVNYDTTRGQPPGLRAIGVSAKMVFAIDDSLGSILVWELK